MTPHRITFGAAFVIGAVGLVPWTAGAQRGPATASQTPRCASGDAKRDTLGRRSLPNGYTIAISRLSGEVEYACIATLRSADGRTVRADSGFGAAVNESTGMDVDGDGTPELILEMDTGGGNHCCWHYAAISLKRPARLLFNFDWSGATDFRRERDGRTTLWSWEGGFFGTDGTMAGRLFAQKVYRYVNAKLVDVTPQFCDAIRTDTTRYQVKAPDADALRRLTKFGPNADSTYGVATDIEELMLQEVFCRRFDRALEMARTMWPAADRARFITSYRDMVVAAYKEYAAAMRDWR